MANPILAFYDAAKITAPDNVDSQFPSILKISYIDKLDPATKLSSLKTGKWAAEAILGRVREITRLTLSNVEILNTAPSDGVNIVRQDNGRPVMIETLRGDELIHMTQEKLAEIESKIYQKLGEGIRPLLAKNAKVTTFEAG